MSFMFSKAKDENVVKPPKKPINTRNLSLLSISPFIENKPKKRPINNEPTIFTAKVPVGKLDVFFEAIKSEITKRKMLPIAPPIII